MIEEIVMFDQMIMATFILAAAIIVSVIASESLCDLGTKLFKRKVGPTYWGVYGGASVVDAPNELKIELPKPSRDSDGGAYGGKSYASGKAVKSASAK